VRRGPRGEAGSLDELNSLAEAAGYAVVGSLEQVGGPDSRYLIGRGKAEELNHLVRSLEAERVIFDNELRPIQAYNLAKLTGVEVIDRLQLILQIFSRRASTREAELQIRLAELRYELPRARERVRLARLGEQPGFLGLGRYEVDVYFDAIRHQMAYIRSELKDIRAKRTLHRSRRRELGFPLVSLAGYTNSGKSTLFNRLTRESVPVSMGLFTTLSTTTRAVSFDGRKALLTDTVGFIDRLPLILVEAFHSTLEETILADSILLILDVSEAPSEVERKLSCCIDTINQIGAGGVPITTALNKVDLLTNGELEDLVRRLGGVVPNPVPISALRGINIDSLRETVSRQLGDYVKAILVLPSDYRSMSLLSQLHDQANVLGVEYKEKTVEVRLEGLAPYMAVIMERVKELGGEVLEWSMESPG